MTGVFADSSVIIDAISDDVEWSAWSRTHIEQALDAGPVWINGVVYAEVGHRFDAIDGLDLAIRMLELRLLDMPKSVFFLSSQAFRAYRARGGTRTAILPDFFIGAHALLLDATLITRDPKRFRQAFPDLKIVSPGTA